MKILLITHMLNFSGAPVALLELARALKKIKDVQISIFSMSKDEGLLKEFKDIGVSVKENYSEKNDFDIIFYNTVLSTNLLQIPVGKAKKILWIHESPYLANLAWSPYVKMDLSGFADLIWFPSDHCYLQWKDLITIKKYIIRFSPVHVENQIKEEGKFDSERLKFCIIDPRESYRGIEKIENFLRRINNKFTVDFVGTLDGGFERNKSGLYKYHGRLKQLEALQILRKSDIYISATSMATQNRGLCEALMMGKMISISGIEVHREIAQKINLKINKWNPPLSEINTMEFTKDYDYSKVLELFGRSSFENYVFSELLHC